MLKIRLCLVISTIWRDFYILPPKDGQSGFKVKSKSGVDTFNITYILCIVHISIDSPVTAFLNRQPSTKKRQKVWKLANLDLQYTPDNSNRLWFELLVTHCFWIPVEPSKWFSMRDRYSYGFWRQEMMYLSKGRPFACSLTSSTHKSSHTLAHPLSHSLTVL